MKRFSFLLQLTLLAGVMLFAQAAHAQRGCAVEISVDKTARGTFVLTANAKGQDPFKFEWSTGETTQRIEVKAQGEYCVAMSDADGCRARSCARVGDTGSGRCQVKIVPRRTPNDSMIVLVASTIGTTGQVKYEWSTGETTPTITVPRDKEAEYCVAITDENGCTAKACFEIEEEDCEVEIIPRRTGADSVVVLFAKTTGTGSGLTYEWSTGDTTETIEIDPSQAGKYCVTITDEEGCKAEDCFEIKGQQDRCAVRIKMDRTLTGDIVLAAYPVGTAPFTFEWSTGDTTQRISVDKAGEYCVSITDANGCQSRSCIEVRIPGNDRCATHIKVSGKDSTGSVTLTALTKGKAPFTYEWSTGETTESITVDSAGTYCVTVTDSAGCQSRDCFRFRTRTDKRCRVFIKPARTNDSTVTLTAHMRGGTAPYTYEWSTGETTSSIEVSGGGEYCVVVKDDAGCEARACFKLRKRLGTGEKRDTCGVKIQVVTIRGGKGAILLAKGFGDGRLSYEWDNGETSQRIVVDQEGTYCVSVKDSEGCVAKTCVDVKFAGGGSPSFKVYPNPVIDNLFVEWTAVDVEIVAYSLTDVRGNVKIRGEWKESGQVQKVIDATGLQSGAYVLTLKTSNDVQSFRIFKR